jgi:hypothetical protein
MREEDLEIAVKVRNNFIFYFFLLFLVIFFIPGFGEAISVLYSFWRVCVDCIFA